MPFPRKDTNPTSIYELADLRLVIHPADAPEVERIVRGLLEALRDALVQGRDVELPGIGVLRIQRRSGRKVRENYRKNPKIYQTGPRWHVRLQTRQALQRRLNRSAVLEDMSGVREMEK